MSTCTKKHFDVDISGIVRRKINMDETGNKLPDMMTHTTNRRLTTAAEALGHREFIMTRI